MKKKFASRLLAGLAAISSAIAFAPTGAQSQQAAAAQAPATGSQVSTQAASSGELQKVTVTGYIVPRVGDGPQPVLTLDRDYFEHLGEQSVSDVLQRLPQNAGYFTPSGKHG